MATLPNPSYDPGRPNYPGTGQSPTNPMPPVFFQSLGVVEDLSTYRNIFSGGTVNSQKGFTLGLKTFFGTGGFQLGQPGSFTEDVVLEKNITIGGSIFMGGNEFKPKVINTISGPHLVLAAY